MTSVSNLMTVATASQDFSWTAAGAWSVFLGVIALIIRQVGPWREIAISGQQKFQTDLLERVEALEGTLADERTAREEERRRYDNERNNDRRRHEAERALDRHRLNNVTQCFDALLLMLKRAPEKVAEIILDIEEMRARQLQAEALEKATIHAVLIDTSGDEH